MYDSISQRGYKAIVTDKCYHDTRRNQENYVYIDVINSNIIIRTPHDLTKDNLLMNGGMQHNKP